LRILKGLVVLLDVQQWHSFTHHDPLEDTERGNSAVVARRYTSLVSPITIRLRILKDRHD